jgi:hypothetical protein
MKVTSHLLVFGLGIVVGIYLTTMGIGMLWDLGWYTAGASIVGAAVWGASRFTKKKRKNGGMA